MSRVVFGILLSALMSVPAGAVAQDQPDQQIPRVGDFFLISRHDDGSFSGSHKLLVKPHEGYRKVRYCDRTFYVIPYTVAWTELETENSRVVNVEYNRGKGWQIVCQHPERQVTLRDLNINIDATQVTRDYSNSAAHRAERFKAISNAFSQP